MRMTASRVISALVSLLAAAAVQHAQADSLDGWNGCNVGINAGYGWAPISGTDVTMPPPAPVGSATARGTTFGAQAGCDLQTTNWVFGAQVLLDKAHLTGSHQYLNGSGPADKFTYDISSLVTVTGRIGYAFQPDTMVYLRAGGAWAKTNHDDTDPAPLTPPPYTGNTTATRNGWSAGIGLEHILKNNLSSYVEYNHIDFGNQTVTIAYTDGVVSSYSFKQKVDHVGFGVNYRFR